jgi:YVTN family beta-propeller protein
MNTVLKKWILYAFLLPTVSLFANTAYVGNNTNISVFDTSTNSITDTIALGTHPVLIALTPNNLFAYVTEANDSVGVINTGTHAIQTTIILPAGSAPVGIAITPNAQLAYVNNLGNNTVSMISTATSQVVGTISGFAEPWGIIITPDGRFAYVVNLNGGVSPGFISVIDLSSNTVLAGTIQVGAGPTGIAITPNGQFVYVTNENSNTVSVISTATNSVVTTIPVGINPFEVAANPNGQFVYVSNNAYTNPSNSSISVISTATNTVVATIPLGGSEPADLAVTPDGQTLYVTNTIDVSIISTATNQVIGSIPISHSSSIAITSTLIAGLTGQQRINDFGLLHEYFNELQWQSVPYSDVIGYNVYRNGALIATVSSTTLQYSDHNRKKNAPVLYSVAPILASGEVSTSISVVVTPK